MAQDAVEDALGTISRQVGEDNDNDLVVSVVAASGLSLQEQSLVAADELDDVGLALPGDLFRSKPQDLTFHGPRHEGTDGPSAAEIFVRPDHEGLDPAGDGLQRFEIAFR
jgi:hypothetical protein